MRDISSIASRNFLHGVRQLYIALMSVSSLKFPIADEVWINAKLIDSEKRGSIHISNAHYILEWNPTSLSLYEADRGELFVEVAKYKLLNDDDILETVWVLAREREYIVDSTPTNEVFVRMDAIWAFPSSVESPDHQLYTNYKNAYLLQLQSFKCMLTEARKEQQSITEHIGGGAIKIVFWPCRKAFHLCKNLLTHTINEMELSCD